VPFGEPVGLAFDSTGKLLVADKSKEAIDFFSPSNAFLAPSLSDATVTGGAPFTAQYVLSVAVDNLPGANQGMVYVAESGTEDVDVFKPDPEAPGKYVLVQERHFGGFVGVAFDNSSGPNAGRLYVFANSQVVRVTLKADGTLPESEAEPGVVPLPTPVGGFGGDAESLAVGPTGKVYFANGGEKAVDVYSNTGVLELASITGAETPAGSEAFQPVAVGVDPTNSEVYVVDAANNVVDEFSPEGKYLGQITRGFVEPRGVAVNATGDVYVSDESGKAVYVFGPDALLPFPAVTIAPAGEVDPTSATLNGTVNPEGVALTDCHFDYVEAAHYHSSGADPYSEGQTAPCAPSAGEIATDTEPHPVQAAITGLQFGTTYHFRLQAANAQGAEYTADVTFSTPPPPVISGESATNLTAEAVDLNANINPEGLKTTYRFEYGKSTEYGTSTPEPDGEIPAGTSDVPVTQHLTGLEHDRTYHWRLVAKNASGTVSSPDHTFIYATTGGSTLPDNRAYEMVTPVHKNAALIGDILFGATPLVSEDGSRLILSSAQCFADAGSCVVNRARVGTPYEFDRTGASTGWTAKALAPKASEFELNAGWSVNPDTGIGLFSMPTAPHGEDDLYARGTDGSFKDIGPISDPALGAGGPKGAQGAASVGTKDLSRIAFEERQPLWPSLDETLESEIHARNTVYEYAGVANTEPLLVGVSGGPGSRDLISRCGTTLAGQGAAGVYAMSVNGDRTFFTAEGGKKCFGSGVNSGTPVRVNGLYARVGGAETVKISERFAPDCNSAGCETSTPGDAEFKGASLDGSRVFFTSTQRLVDAGSEDGGQGDLYEAELVRNGEGEMVVGGVWAASGGSVSGGPQVQGVMAVSGDGGRVFFVARSVLDPRPNSQGRTAVDGGENLYVWSRAAGQAGGTTRFIGTLAETVPDVQQWTFALSRANVTPDGRFLLFTSQAPLTSDDTRAVGGPAQVFRYDTQTDQLVRVSVGEEGFNDNGNAGVGDAHIVEASLARATLGAQGHSSPSMSADGQSVFFMSPVGLTRGALDDVLIGKGPNGEPEYAQNVYEWRGGHVFLVSDGRDANVLPVPACQGTISAVCLIGVSSSGRDVFFTSADRLVPADTDSQLDFYDARVCSSGDPCVTRTPEPLPGCEGEACHGIPAGTPPPPGAPSASFNGAGNLTPASAGASAKPACSSRSGVPSKACTRRQNLTKALAACKRRFPHSKNKRASCEKAARKRYAAARRASSHKAGSHA
jgi:hypothetical protein